MKISPNDQERLKQPSAPFEGHPQERGGTSNQHLTSKKTPAQEYAELYGAAIRQAEDTLSTVNVIASDRKPDAVDISRAVKDILKGIAVQRDIRESGSYVGQVTFYGKTMKINDALFEGNAVTNLDDSGTSFSVSDTPSVLADKAKKLLNDIIDRKLYPKATKDYLKKQITRFFRKDIAELDDVDEKASAATSKLILLNEGLIKKIVRELDDDIRQMSSYEFTSAVFRFPKTFRIPPEADMASKGLMHFPLPRTASGPERIFERILNNADNNVLLWYKNPDHGANAFCVKYSQRHQVRGRTVDLAAPTYPDFIVIFKDGGIGMYEIKDYDKQDPNDDPKALAINETVRGLTGSGYMAKGGLAYIDQRSGSMRDAERYRELQ